MNQKEALEKVKKEYPDYDVNTDKSMWHFVHNGEETIYRITIIQGNCVQSGTGKTWGGAIANLATEIKRGKS